MNLRVHAMMAPILPLLLMAHGAWSQQPLPPAAPPSPGTPEKADVLKSEKDFLQHAAALTLAGRQLAQLGKERGKTEDVRAQAEQIEKDHARIQHELEVLAASKKVPLPTEPNRPQKVRLTRLKETTDTAFRDEFLRQAAADHERALRLYARTARHALDDEVRAFAASTLPLLKARRELPADSSAR